MKRNLILLATILISSIILWMTYSLSFSGKFDKISKNERLIAKDYEKYLNHKIIRDAKHPTSDKMLARNIDNRIEVGCWIEVRKEYRPRCCHHPRI